MRNSVILFALLGLTLVACKKDPPVRSASITYVKVTAWPTTNSNGAPWDATSNPDLYFEILESDLSKVPNDPMDDSVYVDVSGMLVTRTMDVPFRIQDPTIPYFIQLVDNDEADADDVIGRVSFELDTYPDQPAVIFRNENGITMEIGLRWD